MEAVSRSPRVSILLPYPFEKPFTYAAESPLAPGTLVRVPLGKRMAVGVVWGDSPDESVRAKPIAEILDFPPFPQTLMDFIDWVAAYTLSKRGEVLALALKENLLAAAPKRAKKFTFGGADPSLPGPDLSAGQTAAVAALHDSARSEKFSVTLLDGVTGSGKTEVYLEAVAEALRAT